MSTIQPITDPSGTSSDLQLLQKNMQMVIDEFNRQQSARTGNLQETTTGIIINDSATNRIAIGLLPDNTWGIVVVKPGIDIAQVFS